MSGTEFRLPDLGEGLAEAEIVEWLAEVGAEVTADQPVVLVETAKAQVELPAPVSGRLTGIARKSGDLVAVGEPLFTVEPAAGAAPPKPAGRRRVLAAPSTRRLAVEHGVDLAAVDGSGPNGRVEAGDVLAHVAQPAPVPVAAQGERPSEVRPLRGLRRQIARAMTASLTVPQITEFRQLDAEALETARAELGEAGHRVSVLPLLVRIVAAALRRHPEFNAHFDSERAELTLHDSVDLGIATATPGGLIVPVLRAAGSRSIPGTGREIERLAEAARERELNPRETSGATCTISNFGSYGTWLGTPLIVPPQVSIIGVGRVRDEVVPVGGVPAVRRVLPLAVAADHRVVDGAELGAFASTIERLVRSPLLLLGEG